MDELDKTNNSIYTHDELVVMEKTKNIRLNIIDSMVKDGIPSKVGEIRVLNELLAAAESNVQTSANNRLKYQDTQNKEATLDTISEMFKVMRSKTNNIQHANRVIELEDIYIPSDIVDGELEIVYESLDLADYVGKD